MKTKIFYILSLLFIGCKKESTTMFSLSKEDKLIASAGTTNVNANYVGYFSYGQSLSVGGDGGKQNAVISSSPSNNAVMFNLGVRTMDYKQSPTSFSPLFEQLNSGGVMGETPCSGLANMFCQLYPNKPFQLFACASGQPSQTIDSLSKGSRYYNRLIKNITSANSIANSTGNSFSTQAITWTQGEADYLINTNYDYYINSLIQLMNDVNTDAKSITKQSYNAICIINQIGSNNRSQQAMDSAPIAVAQIDACISNPNFILGTPLYIFDYLSDNTHLSDTAYNQIGAFDGQALRDYMADGSKNFVYLKDYAVRNNGIYLSFNSPVGKLVLDTVNVSNPGNYGFVLKSESNSVKINHVSIINDTTIYIKTSSSPIGTTLMYAISNGLYKKAGRLLGSRGNLHDSNDVMYSIGNNKIIMYHWCPAFKINLN